MPSAMLLALGILAAAAGLWTAWRQRALAPLLYASALLACVAVILVGSPWVDAKALAIAAPVALSLSLAGGIAALRADAAIGSALLAAVAAGVVWSNVLAYGGVSLAPYDRMVELEQIGEEFAGQGPALMAEYEPYGARHFLRTLDAEGASELRVRPVTLRDGGTAEKGESVDVDEIDQDALFVYRTLVLRRSPRRSRPPAAYRLLWSGEYYEVWQRPPTNAGSRPEHRSLGESPEVASVPECAEVRRLAGMATENGGGGRLLAARPALYYDATNGAFAAPRGGRYRAWLKGSVRGRVELTVDGREAGDARHKLNNDGGYIDLGKFRLDAETHEAKLSVGGADLHPGSGGFPRPRTGPLLIAPATDEREALIAVSADEAERLCGREWDWIEAQR